MSEKTVNRKLADAIEAVAAVAMEMIENRIRDGQLVLEQKMATGTLQPLFTVKQAAEYYHVSQRTIQNWVARGHLPHYRFGQKVTRIPMKTAEELIRDHGWVRVEKR